MNDSQLRKKFFYGMQEAGLYDATIEWVAPEYQEMHQMMLRLATESLQGGRIVTESPVALDIGCGTGMEAIPLMEAVPEIKLIGVDLCEPMCKQFREAAGAKNIPDSRYSLLKGDILNPNMFDNLQAKALGISGSKSYQLVISAFTIHHLTHAEKLEVGSLIYNLLEDGGVFILGDLFNFGGDADESSWLTNRVFHWETDWIAKNFEESAQGAEKRGDREVASKYRNLKRGWLKHYHQDNLLESVSAHFAILRESGFSQLGNPFRYSQVGLIWARKG